MIKKIFLNTLSVFTLADSLESCSFSINEIQKDDASQNIILL